MVSATALASTPSPVVHGTINVVMGNSNGIVLLTDSMQTGTMPDGHDEQLPAPGQKLFQLDETTVCAVAGFLSASTEKVPEFLNNTAAIIERYKRQVPDGSQLTLDEKLAALEKTFEFFIEGTLSIRLDSREAEKYKFEMFIAGYDSKGQATLASFVIGWHGAGAPHAEIEESSETLVGKVFVYGLHGEPDVAEDVMQNPHKFLSDPAIKDYATAKCSGRVDSLSLDQMKALAIALAKVTSDRYKSVGGPNQIAVIKGGHVFSVEQPSFSTPKLPPFDFGLVGHNTATGPVLSASSSRFALSIYVGNRLTDCGKILLDRAVFIDNGFVRCVILYDGGRTRFESDNKVVNSALVIGPHAKNREQVDHLIHDFSWALVCYGQEAESRKMSCTDNVGAKSERDLPWPWPHWEWPEWPAPTP
jgi:20S proteasome alpha/beta subunit